MRTQLVVGFAALLVMIAPAPAVAFGFPPIAPPSIDDLPVDPPVEAPVAPAWVGQYQGVIYEVRDGVVDRVDGESVQSSAAEAVLKAKRAADMVEANPEFVQRLADRAAAESDLTERIAQVQAAVSTLRGLAAAYAPGEITGLLGGVSGGLPVSPESLLAEASALEGQIDEAKGQADAVKAASQDVLARVESFRGSHSVEDKLAMFESFAHTIPVYGKVAAQADDLRDRADAALGRVNTIIERSAPDPEGLFYALSGPPQVPQDLESAKGQLEGIKSDATSKGAELRDDAAFMKGVLAEPVENAIPIAWVIGGGAGVAAAGLGALWWLRRRAGIP